MGKFHLWKTSKSQPLWASVYPFVHEGGWFEFREPWFQIPAWSLSSETVSKYGSAPCLISPICKMGQYCEDHWGMWLESVQLREQVSDRQWILLSPKLPLISHILGLSWITCLLHYIECTQRCTWQRLLELKLALKWVDSVQDVCPGELPNGGIWLSWVPLHCHCLALGSAWPKGILRKI